MKLLILIFLLSITQAVARRRRGRPRCGKNEWYDYCFNKKCEATCSEPNFCFAVRVPAATGIKFCHSAHVVVCA
ncbi:hypothetical protein NECAME_05453 [Necator americanus]|uniref:Uncharacterized protein n=1 Tax=Necator americanus TaxID=51031 RepID=W2SJ26_NECAM|nr:hypothetical protein NECAME_05453 [Necator americanus]ETN68861.1 hypothetical protein NECAME_05453 [Necator americanus]